MDENKRSAKISTMHVLLSATDWDPVLNDPMAVGQESWFWYLYDYRRRGLRLIQLDREMAMRGMDSAFSAISTENIRSALGGLFRQTDISAPLSKDTLDRLGLLVLGYWKSTSTHQLTPPEARHRFILVYPTKTEDLLLRPFASPLGGDVSCPLPAKQVQSMFQSVVEIDQTRHPEWFHF